MRKIVIIELAIIFSTLVLVLPLAFTGQNSYSGHKTIDWNNASEALTFDLKTGQTATGWFSLFYNEKTGYIIYNQDMDEIIVQNTYDGRGNFTFTATIDGQYYLSIHHEDPWIEPLEYSYLITAPPILGVDRTVLTAIVITVGVVLALTIAVWDLRRTRTKRENKSTK